MWIVYILNFPSRLVILHVVDCWNYKEATQTSLSFYIVLLCFLSWLYFKAGTLYLFCFNVFFGVGFGYSNILCYILFWHCE
jgi:hypothetical protein